MNYYTEHHLQFLIWSTQTFTHISSQDAIFSEGSVKTSVTHFLLFYCLLALYTMGMFLK